MDFFKGLVKVGKFVTREHLTGRVANEGIAFLDIDSYVPIFAVSAKDIQTVLDALGELDMRMKSSAYRKWLLFAFMRENGTQFWLKILLI